MKLTAATLLLLALLPIRPAFDRYFTDAEYTQASIDQCIEDAECDTDTSCELAERDCQRCAEVSR